PGAGARGCGEPDVGIASHGEHQRCVLLARVSGEAPQRSVQDATDAVAEEESPLPGTRGRCLPAPTPVAIAGDGDDVAVLREVVREREYPSCRAVVTARDAVGRYELQPRSARSTRLAP